MSSTSAFGKLLLITCTGPGGEFLADRTRERAVASVLAGEPGCEVTTASAGSLTAGEFLGLTSASLFSAATAVVLTDLQDAAEGPGEELAAYAAEPSPDVAVILVHAGGQKGKKLLDQLRSAAAVTEVKVEAPKYERDFVGWARGESREVGAPLDDAAATLLVQAVGQDLRALAGAVDQLAATRDGAEDGTAAISADTVRKYFGGRADVRGYEIADAAIEGRFDVALERVRWAESAKVAAPSSSARWPQDCGHWPSWPMSSRRMSQTLDAAKLRRRPAVQDPQSQGSSCAAGTRTAWPWRCERRRRRPRQVARPIRPTP